MRGGTLTVVLNLILIFIGNNHLVSNDVSLLLTGYNTHKRYGSYGSTIPILSIASKPVSIETLFARAQVGVDGSSKRVKTMEQITRGELPVLKIVDAQAWKEDAKLGHTLCGSMMENAIEKSKQHAAALYNDPTIDYTGIHSESRFGDIGDHTNASVNRMFTQHLEDYFGEKGMGKSKEYHDDKLLGHGYVKYHPHEIRSLYDHENKDGLLDNNTIETGVWLIDNPLSEIFKEKIICEVNNLPFIGSSQDVGANTKEKSRYYRVSTQSPSGGLFQLSSDQCLLECSPMRNVEKSLLIWYQV
jgi:hypothetical protein